MTQILVRFRSVFVMGMSFVVYAIHTSCKQQPNQLMPCLSNHCRKFAARNIIHAHHALCKLGSSLPLVFPGNNREKIKHVSKRYQQARISP